MATDFPIKSTISARDKLTRVAKRVSSAVGSRMSGAFNKARKAGARLNKVTRGLRGRMGLTGLVATLGGAASIAGIKSFVDGIAKSHDELAKLSRQTGISAQTIAELGYAAEISGVSGDEYSKALAVMSRNIGQLEAKTGPLYSILKKVNPEFLKQVKGAKNNEQALDLLLRGIGSLDKASQKAALSQAAFGRSGEKMTLLAMASGEEIARLRGNFKKHHAELDGKGLKAAEDYVDANTDLKLALSGIKDVIGRQLLPRLTPLIKRLTEWASANRALIGQKIAAFVEKVAKALPKVAEVLGRVAEVSGKIWNLLGGADGVVAMMGVLAGAKILGGIGALVGALGPLGLVLAGIAAAVAAVAMQWRTATGEALTYSAIDPEKIKKVRDSASYRKQTERLAGQGDRGSQDLLMSAFKGKYTREGFDNQAAGPANKVASAAKMLAENIASIIRNDGRDQVVMSPNLGARVEQVNSARDVGQARFDQDISKINQMRSMLTGGMLGPQKAELDVNLKLPAGVTATTTTKTKNTKTKVTTKATGRSSLAK